LQSGAGNRPAVPAGWGTPPAPPLSPAPRQRPAPARRAPHSPRPERSGRDPPPRARAKFRGSPGVGAVVVQSFEVLPGDELAAVDAGLDGPQPAQDADLLHRAHHGRYIQALQLGVDRVQPPHQVLQEEVEDLRQADQLLPLHQERRHLHPVQVDHLTLVAAAPAAAAPRAGPAAAAGEETVDEAVGEARGLGGAGVQRVRPEQARRTPRAAAGSCGDDGRRGDSHGQPGSPPRHRTAPLSRSRRALCGTTKNRAARPPSRTQRPPPAARPDPSPAPPGVEGVG